MTGNNNNIKSSQTLYYLVRRLMVIMIFMLALSNIYFRKFYEQAGYDEDDEPIIKEAETPNQKYCGKDDCKFLLGYHPLEQESQANMHFESFVQIAQRLNRTIVLPNVGGSRMNVCKPYSFSFYYDIDGLQQVFPTVRFITQQDFTSWTKELDEKPDTLHAYIIPREKPFVVEYYEDSNLRNKECLNKFDLKLNSTTVFKKIYLGVNYLYPPTENNTRIENFMLKELQTDAKVLLMKHTLPTLLFNDTTEFPAIPYSKKLVKIQEKITKKLGSHLAIHWRVENVDPKILPKCSKSLVDWIKNFSKEHQVDNIYFATDYPLHGNYNKAQSSSFYHVTEEHHQAMRILNSTVKLNTWVTLNAFEELKNDQDNSIEEELGGSGIQGILDKLILINADWFVSGPKGCARTQSRFTRRIRYAREKLINSGNTKIKNISTSWTGPE